MEIKTNGDFNRVQINFSEDRTADGTVIKQSLMLNIREDSVQKAYALYAELKRKIEGKEEQPKKKFKQEKKEEKTEIPNCPKCKTPMIIRTNGKTGEPFWSCPQWPMCNGTRPMKKKVDWIPADQDLAVVDIPF